eukprot:scaffold2805_cov202-Prasinococcus_capsulatus_cf.AAC.11
MQVEWMATRGYFPTPSMVKLDPDHFRTQLPEWQGYQRHNPERAGSLTRREAGMILEVAQEAAMRRHKVVWVDGSFRDAEWYAQVFARVRARHPAYRIAIMYVFAPPEVVLRRALRRAARTGRHVPEAEIRDSIARVPRTVAALAPLADFVVYIENNDDRDPRLISHCDGVACFPNTVRSRRARLTRARRVTAEALIFGTRAAAHLGRRHGAVRGTAAARGEPAGPGLQGAAGGAGARARGALHQGLLRLLHRAARAAAARRRRLRGVLLPPRRGRYVAPRRAHVRAARWLTRRALLLSGADEVGLQLELAKRSGKHTVPQLYVRGAFLEHEEMTDAQLKEAVERLLGATAPDADQDDDKNGRSIHTSNGNDDKRAES